MHTDAALAVALRADDTTTATGNWESVQRRHRLLDVLEVSTGEISVSELVDALAADDAELLDADRLHVRLVHVDLPLLEDAGEITYDSDGDAVWLTDDQNRRSTATDSD